MNLSEFKVQDQKAPIKEEIYLDKENPDTEVFDISTITDTNDENKVIGFIFKIRNKKFYYFINGISGKKLFNNQKKNIKSVQNYFKSINQNHFETINDVILNIGIKKNNTELINFARLSHVIYSDFKYEISYSSFIERLASNNSFIQKLYPETIISDFINKIDCRILEYFYKKETVIKLIITKMQVNKIGIEDINEFFSAINDNLEPLINSAKNDDIIFKKLCYNNHYNFSDIGPNIEIPLKKLLNLIENKSIINLYFKIMKSDEFSLDYFKEFIDNSLFNISFIPNNDIQKYFYKNNYEEYINYRLKIFLINNCFIDYIHTDIMQMIKIDKRFNNNDILSEKIIIFYLKKILIENFSIGISISDYIDEMHISFIQEIFLDWTQLDITDNNFIFNSFNNIKNTKDAFNIQGSINLNSNLIENYYKTSIIKNDSINYYTNAITDAYINKFYPQISLYDDCIIEISSTATSSFIKLLDKDITINRKRELFFNRIASITNVFNNIGLIIKCNNDTYLIEINPHDEYSDKIEIKLIKDFFKHFIYDVKKDENLKENNFEYVIKIPHFNIYKIIKDDDNNKIDINLVFSFENSVSENYNVINNVIEGKDYDSYRYCRGLSTDEKSNKMIIDYRIISILFKLMEEFKLIEDENMNKFIKKYLS